MKKVLFLCFLCLVTTFQMVSPLMGAAAPSVTEKEEIALPPEFAEELRLADENGDSRFYEEFLNMLLYLGVILFVVLILMWFLKRANTARIEQVNKNCAIKIIERRSLSPKTTIYLVEIAGKTIALSESVDGVTHLAEVENPSIPLPKNLSSQT